jgi:hypothetical protein
MVSCAAAAPSPLPTGRGHVAVGDIDGLYGDLLASRLPPLGEGKHQGGDFRRRGLGMPSKA